jgi:glucose dehydrogenase
VVDVAVKIARWAKTFLDLVCEPVAGLLMLSLGMRTYHSGGSVGWPIAGCALLLINVRVAWRRFARLGKPRSAA